MPRASLRSPRHDVLLGMRRYGNVTMSNGSAFFLPATHFASVVASFSHPPSLSLRQANPTPRRGGVERRQAHSSHVSRVRGATIRVSDTRAVPLQPGRPLGAPPWRFSAADPRCRLRQWATGAVSDCPRQAVTALAVGVRTSRVADSRRSRGRHSWLRLQVVSGDAPS
jgi:hypothetical protein